MSAALVNSNVTAAVAAMGSGDWSSAINYLTQAQAYLVIIPRSKQGDTEMEFDGAGINQLIAQCRKNLAGANGLGASGGIMQSQKVRYVTEADC